MQFRILGPLEIGGREQASSAGPPRRQALLAVLIAHAGVVVPVDALIEQAWDGRPPPSGRRAVHVYVCGLRQVIAGHVGVRAARDVLSTSERGYRLRLGPDELDATEFQRIVASGDRALRAGHPARASRLATQALALWRGDVLAGLSVESLRHSLVTPLEELRLNALQTKIDAELRLGRHGEVIPELRALVAAHPFRERFLAQLMVALYRCARQAEALALYEQTRRQLREELGADPGIELWRLHRDILRGDPGLALPAGRTGQRSRSVPFVCPECGVQGRPGR